MTNDGTGNWIWAWRKGGVMDGTTYVAFGLVDEGGPPVEDEPWSGLRSSVYKLAREIFTLDVSLHGEAITLTGSVTSEKVKAGLEAIFRGVSDRLRNEVEVTAPLENVSLVAEQRPHATTESVSRFPSVTHKGMHVRTRCSDSKSTWRPNPMARPKAEPSRSMTCLPAGPRFEWTWRCSATQSFSTGPRTVPASSLSCLTGRHDPRHSRV